MDVGEAPELLLRELHVHINVLQARDAPCKRRKKEDARILFLWLLQKWSGSEVIGR